MVPDTCTGYILTNVQNSMILARSVTYTLLSGCMALPQVVELVSRRFVEAGRMQYSEVVEVVERQFKLLVEGKFLIRVDSGPDKSQIDSTEGESDSPTAAAGGH